VEEDDEMKRGWRNDRMVLIELMLSECEDVL
jgi:hypothetical protein